MILDLQQPIVRVCRDCNHTFEIDPREQEFLRELAGRLGRECIWPTRCRECRSARRYARNLVVDDGIDESIVCHECAGAFTFTASQKRFFASRGLVRPRRCDGCRRQRRLGADESE